MTLTELQLIITLLLLRSMNFDIICTASSGTCLLLVTTDRCLKNSRNATYSTTSAVPCDALTSKKACNELVLTGSCIALVIDEITESILKNTSGNTEVS